MLVCNKKDVYYKSRKDEQLNNKLDDLGNKQMQIQIMKYLILAIILEKFNSICNVQSCLRYGALLNTVSGRFESYFLEENLGNINEKP